MRYPQSHPARGGEVARGCSAGSRGPGWWAWAIGPKSASTGVGGFAQMAGQSLLARSSSKELTGFESVASS